MILVKSPTFGSRPLGLTLLLSLALFCRTSATVAGGGACCFPDDVCLEGIEEADCELIGGIYHGEASNCGEDDDGDKVFGCDDLCPFTPGVPVDEFGCPLFGACCVADVGVCLDNLDEETCLAIEGTFQGGGSLCTDPNTCPCVETELLASDGESGDLFGGALAANGDVILVGARQASDDQGIESGAVYAYRFNGVDWLEETKLVTSEGAIDKWFGASVAVDGDIAVIGANQDDPFGNNSGSAYIFNFDGAEWTERIKLLASDGTEGDSFGSSVAVSGDWAVIGAARDDDHAPDAGSAYVFQHQGIWVEITKLCPPGGQKGAWFGNSVAISGDRILIGAYLDDENGNAAGAVYVYRSEFGSWALETKLLASDGMELERFGVCVALDGNVAIIGADRDDENGPQSGSAYVFRFDDKDWIEEAKLLASDGASIDHFGQSVAVDGHVAVVGASNHDDNGPNYGAAYIFRFDGTEWVETTKLLASDGAGNDSFGFSVAFNGEVAVVGAEQHDDDGAATGSVYVYDCDLVGCEGDANGDGVVDPLDSGFVLARFGCPVGTGDPNCDVADQNGDGLVDPLDVGYVLARFGDCP